jgi:hypothetical protein
MTGVFDVDNGDGSRRRILAEVMELHGSNVVLNVYSLVMRETTLRVSFPPASSVFCLLRTDETGNFLASQTIQTIPTTLGEIELAALLDMSTSNTINGSNHGIINKAKFGTYWWLLKTNATTLQNI